MKKYQQGYYYRYSQRKFERIKAGITVTAGLIIMGVMLAITGLQPQI